MVRQSLPTRAGRGDWSPVGAYGAVGLLLLASSVLGVVVAAGVAVLGGPFARLLGPQLTGAVVYATLGFGAVAAGYAVVRRSRAQSARLGTQDLVQLGGVAAMLLFVAAHVLHGETSVPTVPGDVVSPLLVAGLSLALPAIVFARVGGIDLPVAVPGREGLTVGGVAALLAGLAAAAWLLTYATFLGGSVGFGLMGGRFAPSLSVEGLLWRVLVPQTAVGLGLALLYNGAIQAAVRERQGAVGGVAGTTALVGVHWWSPETVGLVTDALGVVGSSAVVALLALGAALVAARAAHSVTRRLDGARGPVAGAAVGLAVVVWSLVAVALASPYGISFVLAGAAIAVVAAVASVGYERTRSVWIPALAFATYLLVLDRSVAAHAVSLLP